MLNLTNYIPEVYKQFCDLIDSASVTTFLLVQCANVLLETQQQHELHLVGMASHPGILL